MLNQYKDLNLWEWESHGWTFHAKGAWFHNKSDESLVDLSVIGSSNFSYRSNRRDTECQLYILPECDDLRRRLGQEASSLFGNSKQVTLTTLKDDPDKIKWQERLLNRLVKNLI